MEKEIKKIALSIEQMKHLEGLGLDTSDASFGWIREGDDDIYLEFADACNFEEGAIPAYSLQNILEKLPLIENMRPVIMRSETKRERYYFVTYSDYVTVHADAFFVCINPLDGTYNLLCWCLENGYIQTNKE